jgi:hypothetical protein
MVNENMQKGNKQGQVAIFIIIAILIVSGVLIYFLWVKPQYFPSSGGELNIDQCIADALEDNVEMLGENGGFLEPDFSYMYNGKEVAYLCYTNLYYKGCTVQKPFLKQHFEDELERAVREEINLCYEDSISELKRKGFDVVSGLPDLDIVLEPGRAVVLLDVPVAVSSQGLSQSFTSFKTEVSSRMYDILMLSTAILQSETRYGEADVTSMMLFYPDFGIDKIRRSDGTTIYIIEDLKSKAKFKFAIRSFAWPAGYGTDTGLVSGV